MRESFELIFEEILIDLIKTPTPVKPNPTPPKTQLPPTLCCLAHGCGLSTLEDVFGWFILLTIKHSILFVEYQSIGPWGHGSALGMGFMYISALNWKTILVLRRDKAYQIWDLLHLINVSFMPLLVHQVAHMMPDVYAIHLWRYFEWGCYSW